jgi:FkbM family methyltransferase
MSYFDNIFETNIASPIKTIFELGSRDILDAIKLQNRYNSTVYAFECNPDCLLQCELNYNATNEYTKSRVKLVKMAVCENDGPTSFFPFDLSKYNNMGSSSMLKIDFSRRELSDPDYNIPNPQKEIVVEGIRLDTFMANNEIDRVDMICMDLQGYELNALKSMGEQLKSVKYILTECSIDNTYINGASFVELNNYLQLYGFEYKCSNKYGYSYPDLDCRGFSEFDALFINTHL